MSEENKQSEHLAANAPQESGTPLPPPTPGAQPVVPSAPQQPATQQPPVQQPAPQQAPAQQPNAAHPQAQGDPQQAPQPPEQSAQQPNQNQQQPTFRENGAFSFFATPSDPDDDPTPMSVGFKIGWFVVCSACSWHGFPRRRSPQSVDARRSSGPGQASQFRQSPSSSSF